MTDFRKLGADGPSVYAIALGCGAMSGAAGCGPDDAESLATIHTALDHGVNLIDTADFYGGGHNELLIGRAIKGRRDEVRISAKFGALRSPQGAFVGLDSRPAAIKNFLTYTLVRLGVDYVDIYRPARLDPQVPIEDTIGAMAELVDAGYVRYIGLSEMGPETIRRAHAVHPICDLQIEYSLMSRNPEAEIFPLLQELGIGVTAYGVLCHGLLSGTARAAEAGDPRAHLPRFRPENIERNRVLVTAFGAIAAEKNVTNSQLAIAWALAKNPGIVPVIGARRVHQLKESLDAVALSLSLADLTRIEAAIPSAQIAGMRYDERLMTMLDSERKQMLR